MSHFTLLVGSTLGYAEDLAEVLAGILASRGHQTVIHTSPQVDHILIGPDHYLLLVCSTHGAGDLPDNIQPLSRQLQEQQPDLGGLPFLAVGLGDSSYDTFCQAIRSLDQQLRDRGAERVGDRLEIDVSQPDLPEILASAWLDQQLQAAGIHP
ncbi:FMN-binding protein MioC [Zobellella denitrificans]|uniref:FMN-binding protein MioC n=1 Tax=Zobellella denitrificans TaxID=347534 RepID=UPI000B8BEA26|nr:FMN-binding protein MioC [Zobellella denitrificans]OXS16082.1 FMN-binding protein MioC [Zobellella denitrificans]